MGHLVDESDGSGGVQVSSHFRQLPTEWCIRSSIITNMQFMPLWCTTHGIRTLRLVMAPGMALDLNESTTGADASVEALKLYHMKLTVITKNGK